MSFDDAVKMAAEDLNKDKVNGTIIILPVKEYQAMGFTAPELADIDTDKLAETLRKRLPEVVVSPTPGPVPPTPDPVPLTPMGFTTWQHPQGFVSISFPADFVSSVQPGVTPGFLLLSVGNPATTVGCDVIHITGTQNPAQAVNMVAGVFGQMGRTLHVNSTSTPGTGGVVMFEGTTTWPAGSARWICLGKPVRGGVVLVSAGASSVAWAAQSATI